MFDARFIASTMGRQLTHRPIRANPQSIGVIGFLSVLGFTLQELPTNRAFFAHFAPKTEKTRKKPVETP
jgi:hypothetical protein